MNKERFPPPRCVSLEALGERTLRTDRSAEAFMAPLPRISCSYKLWQQDFWSQVFFLQINPPSLPMKSLKCSFYSSWKCKTCSSEFSLILRPSDPPGLLFAPLEFYKLFRTSFDLRMTTESGSDRKHQISASFLPNKLPTNIRTDSERGFNRLKQQSDLYLYIFCLFILFI